ncbi:hypothetical protein CR513_12828, partial [Mucuna pruriens]
MCCLASKPKYKAKKVYCKQIPLRNSDLKWGCKHTNVLYKPSIEAYKPMKIPHLTHDFRSIISTHLLSVIFLGYKDHRHGTRAHALLYPTFLHQLANLLLNLLGLLGTSSICSLIGQNGSKNQVVLSIIFVLKVRHMDEFNDEPYVNQSDENDVSFSNINSCKRSESEPHIDVENDKEDANDVDLSES